MKLAGICYMLHIGCKNKNTAVWLLTTLIPNVKTPRNSIGSILETVTENSRKSPMRTT